MAADPSKIDALVVGGVDYGESDRIVQVLTERGRMAVFAPAARKSRRRFSGALEPFNSIEMSVESSRRGMPRLAAAVVRTSRLGLSAELGKIALASYAGELGAAAAPEEGAATELYRLVSHTWDVLLEQPATLAMRRAFELLLIDALGLAPVFDVCAVCGAGPGADAYFDLHRGGLLCPKHGAGSRPVGPKTLEWMRRILAERCLGRPEGIDPEWADTAARKLSPAFSTFFDRLVGRPLRSAELLGNVLS